MHDKSSNVPGLTYNVNCRDKASGFVSGVNTSGTRYIVGSDTRLHPLPVTFILK